VELFKAIHGRRSIRRFTNEPVEDDDLAVMLGAALAAPSGHNHQMWHFVVVKDSALQKQMHEAVIDEHQRLAQIAMDKGGLEHEAKRFMKVPRNWAFFDAAPVTVAVCERILPPDDRIRLLRGIEMSESEIQRRRPSAGLQSVSAAVQNLLLAAHALGYGACWMVAPVCAVFQLEELLGISHPYQLRAIVPVGRPAQVPSAPRRRPLDEVVSFLE
jgi:nitroreductase